MSTVCALEEGEKMMKLKLDYENSDGGKNGKKESSGSDQQEMKLKVDDENSDGGKNGKEELSGSDQQEMKLKVDDENSDGGKNGKEESSGSDQPEYDPDDWVTWPNKDVYIKYYQQLNESDCFEFDAYPGGSMFTPVSPILGFEDHPEFVDRIKGYASMAIKKYFCKHNDGKERKVKEIVRINAGGARDSIFYITFKIDNDGKEETFQAEVACTIERTIEIPICRPKKV